MGSLGSEEMAQMPVPALWVRRQDSALSHGHVLGSFPPWFVAALPLIATLAMV